MTVDLGIALSDKYEILKEVGSGSMGTVYKARHKLLNRQVAIKVLTKGFEADEAAVNRFKRSAKAASALNHPGLANALDFGFLDDNRPYLVVDFLTGTLLQTRLDERGALKAEETIRIAEQICEAMAHAHSKGIVHRNLKPSNVMLVADKNGSELVKVFDFGFAKIVGPGGQAQKLTAPGQVFGTPAYMSPEQCQALDIDERSDIYSIGCLLFKMLTGVPPISGITPMETVFKQVSDAPMPFEKATNNPVSAKLQAVVYKSLAKKPADRYQSADELKSALQGSLQSTQVSQVPTQTVQSAPAAQPRPAPAAEPLVGLKKLLAEAGSGTADSKYAVGQCYEKGLHETKPDLSAAAEWYRKAADQGHSEAQFALAAALERLPTTQNVAEIAEWYRKAAQQGHPDAQVRTGLAFESGLGVKRDTEEALKWFLRAAEADRVEAQFRAGNLLLQNSGDDIRSGIAWIKRAAEKNHKQALASLESLPDILLSRRAPGDIPEAVRLLEPAAATGNGAAQLKLALLHIRGEAPNSDQSKGVRWLRSAADQKLPEALYQLSICYENGTGVAADQIEALNCLKMAADAGHAVAKEKLASSLSQCASTAAMTDGSTDAIRWLLESAQKGNCEAQLNLAFCYKNGDRVAADPGEAERWFTEAAKNRFGSSSFDRSDARYGQMVEYFHGLAHRGHKEAQYWLGICYQDGLGIAADEIKAAQWYIKAWDRQHALAESALQAIPAHIVDRARQGKPKWDKRTTAGPFKLSAENKQLISAAKALAAMDTLKTRIDLYECFPAASVIVPSTPPKDPKGKPQLVVVANMNGEVGLVAFTDFDAMNRWPAATEHNYTWTEVTADEVCNLAIAGKINTVFLNPTETAEVALRDWELSSFVRKTLPLPRGEYLRELIMPDGTVAMMKLPNIRVDNKLRDAVSGVVSQQLSVGGVFLVEAVFEPVHAKPGLVVIVQQLRPMTLERRRAIMNELQIVLRPALALDEPPRVLVLDDGDNVMVARRYAHCLFSR